MTFPKIPQPIFPLFCLVSLVAAAISIVSLQAHVTNLNRSLTSTSLALNNLKGQDQIKINQDLTTKIASIEGGYKQSVDTYERLLDLKSSDPKVAGLDALYALAITQLSQQNFASAAASLASLSAQIKTENAKISASFSVPQNTTTSNTPPGSGFSRQLVHTDAGDFMVDIIAADLNSTRVIIDTASDNDCGNNCPTLPLDNYVSRSGAYAGVNGTYFCPESYPSCAGKTNSFDLLVMNKNKHYFNSSNNVYSTNPAVSFYGNTVRFMDQALQWGRDTGVDAVISNFPLLVKDGHVVFGGNGDPKMTGKSTRGFVAGGNNTAYIGIVYNSTMTESAKALAALGFQNAMNLDDGGSAALWYGGYKVGPGRAIPNAILFVRK